MPRQEVGSRRYTPEEILAQVAEGKKTFDGYTVRMNSLRYRVFARDGCQCVGCGIVGSTMILERYVEHDSDSAHFNLYAVTENGMVLMTKDHVIPKVRGGPDHLDNLVVLCEPCNIAKAATLTPTVEKCLGLVLRLSQGRRFDTTAKSTLVALWTVLTVRQREALRATAASEARRKNVMPDMTILLTNY